MSEQHWLDRKLFNSSYDRELMWVVLLLIVFGMVMIYSASVDGRLYKTGNQYYYLFRYSNCSIFGHWELYQSSICVL